MRETSKAGGNLLGARKEEVWLKRNQRGKNHFRLQRLVGKGAVWERPSAVWMKRKKR